MRVLIFLICLNISMSKIAFGQNPKDRIFILNKNMIQDFDTIGFKVKLTGKAKQELSNIDFSQYSFLWIPNMTTLILILKWNTQVLTSDILVYRNSDNNIIDKDGTIQISVRHLLPTDIRVIRLRNYLKNEK